MSLKCVSVFCLLFITVTSCYKQKVEMITTTEKEAWKNVNNFSLDWYSYNETEGDFEMKNFTIANDLKTLVPFINEAQQFAPNLKIWASPWSPPSWMKWNKHYACAVPWEGLDKKYQNNLPANKQGIQISMIMPQNEFNSRQIFPSCTWTAAGLHKRYPDLKLYQTEQECGDGKNDWKYCRYAWTLMKHFTVNKSEKKFRYNHEYYLLKHFSHFVKPGAKFLRSSGTFTI
jgi:O-glycosyl hydrolase